MGWRSVGKKPIRYKGGSWQEPFTGVAEVFEWDGSDPAVKKNHAHYAAIVKLDDIPWPLGGTGYVGDAVKAAFPGLRRSRLGSAKAEYTDWGDPIGTPANYGPKWKKGIGALTFRVAGRMASSEDVARRFLARKGPNPNAQERAMLSAFKWGHISRAELEAKLGPGRVQELLGERGK